MSGPRAAVLSRVCRMCPAIIVRIPGKPGPLPSWCPEHENSIEACRARGTSRKPGDPGYHRNPVSLASVPTQPREGVDVGFGSELGMRLEQALARAEVLAEIVTRAASIEEGLLAPPRRRLSVVRG